MTKTLILSKKNGTGKKTGKALLLTKKVETPKRKYFKKAYV